MCLYCPMCGIRTPCEAYEKSLVARDIMDFEWAEMLEEYCSEITYDHIVCSACHAR